GPNELRTGGSASAVRIVAAATPGNAKEKIASRFRQNSSASSLNAASNSSPGRNRANSSSFVSAGGRITRRLPMPSPATTSATVYGMRSRCATSATTVASTKSSKIDALRAIERIYRVWTAARHTYRFSNYAHDGCTQLRRDAAARAAAVGCLDDNDSQHVRARRSRQ